MPTFSIDIVAGKDLAQRLGEATARQRKAVGAAVALTGLDILTDWRRGLTPRGTDTGRLKASTRFEMRGLTTAVVFTDVAYAPHVEFGTRPHTIRVTPRARGFFWHMHRKTGEDKWRAMALSKVLRHPGTRGTLALTRARNQAAPRFQRRLVEALAHA